ncbi:hypothetical protein FLK61_36895 [Paenalkalicoccus suaedae]|uniref:Spore coat protein n=1 Tax=Paenalkalicoccus suaedae TaxID=2592382 RepID=A0A859FFU0_9BACI|nr:hypothetical protein [Paenalkalicoccus suaedae]QKS72223.1 hypothetical protein FLK61_36895 [Paenalkalicoccus suaedae]
MQNNTQPPDVITVKDHLYLEDMLSWNLLAMKKANALSEQCTDPSLKETLTAAGRMHERHYQKLLTHLQPGGHVQ